MLQNKKINMNSTLKIHKTSGNTSATNSKILVVPHKLVNLLGRDILQKLGIRLPQSKKGEKTNNNLITTNNQKITDKIFKKFAIYAPVSKYHVAKHHVAKSTFKHYFKPT